MCTICGGAKLGKQALDVFHISTDRGRDYSNLFFRKGSWIANHRAIPTTEIENTEFNQPFGSDYKIVHNGVIANDRELGNKENVIDSYILSKALDFTNIDTLQLSLQKIQGSYALGVMKPNGHFYLACNYKPIFYAGLGTNEFVFSSYEHHLTDAGYENVKRLTPYSILDTETLETREVPREVHNKVAVIASAGLDSTAVAAYAVATYGPDNVMLIHYQYGAIAEAREVERIAKIAEYLQCQYVTIPINMAFAAKASTLLGKNQDQIKDGIAGAEYAYEWVPARNFIMIALATGFAEANGYDILMLGTNLEEGGAYPDNENQWIKDVNYALYGAVQNGKKVRIETPVGDLMKHEIVPFGLKYDAPFHLTWSCYKDGEHPCMECGPDFMRITAFERNGLVDPIIENALQDPNWTGRQRFKSYARGKEVYKNVSRTKSKKHSNTK